MSFYSNRLHLCPKVTKNKRKNLSFYAFFIKTAKSPASLRAELSYDGGVMSEGEVVCRIGCVIGAGSRSGWESIAAKWLHRSLRISLRCSLWSIGLLRSVRLLGGVRLLGICLLWHYASGGVGTGGVAADVCIPPVVEFTAFDVDRKGIGAVSYKNLTLPTNSRV